MNQVDQVRERLGGQWMLGHVEVNWMVPRWMAEMTQSELLLVQCANALPQMHAVGAGLMSLCGAVMTGSWRKRRHIDPESQCAICAAHLRQHGRLV